MSMSTQCQIPGLILLIPIYFLMTDLQLSFIGLSWTAQFSRINTPILLPSGSVFCYVCSAHIFPQMHVGPRMS
ncbi:hypothetical protein F5884DRAFT_311717 [Xylogone sp. PMI_703]|nr:hypothetical protein F5884DRAFT_311717 [Xylogone sp. PMI_703]